MNHKYKKEIHNAIKEYMDEENITKGNRIVIGDFEVTSTSAKLKDVERTIDRLIEKHKGFAEIRKQKRTFENHGVFS